MQHSDLKYASWDGTSWVIEIVDGVSKTPVVSTKGKKPEKSLEIGEYSSLVLNSDGNPRISYFDKTHGNLKYASWDGTAWKIETVDGTSKAPKINPRERNHDRFVEVGEYSSLALNSGGNPCISYYDKTHGDLRYAAWNGTSWETETVDSSGRVGEFTSLKLDDNGDPRISYYDRTNKVLKFAVWTGARWQIETADNSKKVGTFVSLALDSAGDARISYFDQANRNLRYVRSTGHAQKNQIALQLYGKDITQGEYLQNVSPEFLVNLSPDALQRLYATKMDWHNTFDKVSSGSTEKATESTSQLLKTGISAKASASQGIPVLLVNSRFSQLSKNVLRSWSRSDARTEILLTPYTAEIIGVETHLQRADNPPGLFTTWEDVAVKVVAKELASSAEAQVDVPITKSGYYRVFGFHTLKWDNLGVCSTPTCANPLT